MQNELKTRLLYIWVDSFKLLNNVGFNFTADYDVDFEPGNIRLTIAIRDNVPQVFDELKNITAIVGKNGTGKSTLLDLISETLYEGYNPYGFAVFERDDGNTKELFLSCGPVPYRKELIQSFDKSLIEQPISPTSDNFKAGKIAGLALIKYDPNLSNNVARKKFNNRVDFHTLSRHKFSQKNKQHPIHIFKNIPLIESSFEDSTFDETSIVYTINQLRVEELINESFNLIYEKECDDILLKSSTERSLEGFYALAFDGMLLNLESSIKNYDRSDLQLIFSCFISSFKANSQLAKIFCLLYISDLISGKDRLNSVRPLFVSSIIRNIGTAINDSKVLVDLSKEYSKNFGYKGVNKEVLGFSFNKDDNNTHLQFIRAIEEWESKYQLPPSWLGISSGQLSLINLFSGLLDLNKNTRSKSVLILLDEAEQTLHPEWQRSFISSLIHFTKNFLQADSIQIVVTTHSPFCLSDVLNENVIYLKSKVNCGDGKGNSNSQPKKSFAANIHSLLVNEFFMKKTIGEYCATLVHQTVQFMESSGEDKSGQIKNWNDARAVIDQVADELMRDELDRIYKEANVKEVRNELVGKLEDKKDELLRLMELGDFSSAAKIIEDN